MTKDGTMTDDEKLQLEVVLAGTSTSTIDKAVYGLLLALLRQLVADGVIKKEQIEAYINDSAKSAQMFNLAQANGRKLDLIMKHVGGEMEKSAQSGSQ